MIDMVLKEFQLQVIQDNNSIRLNQNLQDFKQDLIQIPITAAAVAEEEEEEVSQEEHTEAIQEDSTAHHQQLLSP